MTLTRQPAGVPVGGQFATTARTEATDVDLTGTGAAEPTPLEEEFDELIEEAQVGYAQALEHHQDTVSAARTAATYGTAADRRQHNDLHDSALDDLKVAERRCKAVTIAADVTPHRPAPEEFTTPDTLTALRRALKDAKGGRVRGLVLTSAATAKLDGRLDIDGPADGTPLFIDIASGFSPVRVRSGFVVISAGSTMGNGIEVTDAGTAVVLAGPGRKVSTAVEGGVACVVGADEARGYQFRRGGVLDVVGKTDAITVSELPR